MRMAWKVRFAGWPPAPTGRRRDGARPRCRPACSVSRWAGPPRWRGRCGGVALVAVAAGRGVELRPRVAVDHVGGRPRGVGWSMRMSRGPPAVGEAASTSSSWGDDTPRSNRAPAPSMARSFTSCSSWPKPERMSLTRSPNGARLGSRPPGPGRHDPGRASVVPDSPREGGGVPGPSDRGVDVQAARHVPEEALDHSVETGPGRARNSVDGSRGPEAGGRASSDAGFGFV